MNKPNKLKLTRFQKFIKYQFHEPKILLQALTTPQFGNENNLENYQILETLGDAVIKLIFSLKLYKRGEEDPGQLTKTKQCLESNKTFLKIAENMDLARFIFSSEKQTIEGTSILADVFEAICGAIFIDSAYDLKLVEEKIIDRFLKDWTLFIEDSTNFSKNELLEFLQNKFNLTPVVEVKYQNVGPQHDIQWIAKNPKIYDQNKNQILHLPPNLTSKEFKTKKDAEKDLSKIILQYLKENNNNK